MFLPNVELDMEVTTNPRLDEIFREQREQLKKDLIRKGINLDYEIRSDPKTLNKLEHLIS